MRLCACSVGCAVRGVQCVWGVCGTRLPERGRLVGGELYREEATPLIEQLLHLALLGRGGHEHAAHLGVGFRLG